MDATFCNSARGCATLTTVALFLPSNPTELHALRVLRDQGFSPREIREALKLTKATYYRRLADLRALEAEAKERRRAPDL